MALNVGEAGAATGTSAQVQVRTKQSNLGIVLQRKALVLSA